jgi:hypothetical protein
MNLRSLCIALVVIGLIGAARWYPQRSIAHASGVLIDSTPQQGPPSSADPITLGEYRLTPLADFDLEARVLSREDYRFDEGSDLSPTDLALGWQRMSDTAVIEQLDIDQSVRFYTYRWQGDPPIPTDEIIRSSANMHLIPLDEHVADELARIRKGELIRLRGRLVEAHRSDGYHWRSSLTREDTGAGACELVLVEWVEPI